MIEPAEKSGWETATMSPLQTYDLGHSRTGGVRCHNQVGIKTFSQYRIKLSSLYGTPDKRAFKIKRRSRRYFS